MVTLGSDGVVIELPAVEHSEHCNPQQQQRQEMSIVPLLVLPAVQNNVISTRFYVTKFFIVATISYSYREPALCRYNRHSAGSLGWPFPVLKYKYISRTKYTEAILSSASARKLLQFEITKMLIAVYCVIIRIFGKLSFPIKYSCWFKV